MSEHELTEAMRLVEAVIFAHGESVTLDALQRQVGEGVELAPILSALRDHYATRGVNLVETGGHWSFRTAPDLSPHMKIVRQPRRKLPRAASEVLAIIAYHQPVTRAEIESIRGVDTGKGTLDILLELGWVRPGKRRETPGRPLTWKTTDEFLGHFGISSLKELPGLDELKAAGLLDARPVAAHLPREAGDDHDDAHSPIIEDDAEFAHWLDDETVPDTDPSRAAG